MMNELSDYSSDVIEFKPLISSERQKKLVDACTATDALPTMKDVSLETNPKKNAETQTLNSSQMPTECSQVDEMKLALWLRKIYPLVEGEILKGPTPIPADIYMKGSSSIGHQWTGTGTVAVDEPNIQTYQKISFTGNSSGQLDSLQGLATWLSVHTNNAPVLVVTTIAPHDDWCEHVNQSIRIFIPKRLPSSNFVVFTEMKKIPVKACLKVLITNPHNKRIFVGSTLDGDIYIWQYEPSSSEVNIMVNFTATHGYATAMDWPAENRLLTAHSNGYISQWKLIATEVVKETEYLLQPPILAIKTQTLSNEITTLVCLSGNDFVVGTKDGGVYHCWTSNMGTIKRLLEITALKGHLFMVSSLLKTKIPGYNVLISCDLSGQVFYHDIQNMDDDGASVMVQIPLPFKNSIACSNDGNIIYCPGLDGSLEYFNLRSGVHSFIKGALRGKGSLIKCSDNGNWIITGLYANEFEIFYVEN